MYAALNYPFKLLKSLAGLEIKYILLLLSSTFTKGTITVKCRLIVLHPTVLNNVFLPIRKLHALAFEAKMKPSLQWAPLE
jgi:hypothetical protein